MMSAYLKSARRVQKYSRNRYRYVPTVHLVPGSCSVPVPPIKPHQYDILTILTRLLLCRCNCEEGFTGKNCETTYVPCDPSPCQNGGQCNPFGPYNYTCQCPTGMYPVPYNGGTLNVMKTVAGTWSSYPPLAELRKFHISF